ncbi:Carboxypeptidase [Quillaja saponaria]|uniref:Carboxypeptidase n=1 Tax=Quillaja saponaria TaxID=32244 RepID=A0AAD7KXM9_QUISA|nr:Carboxypeptidase [Quillaja saponaria]
MQGIISSHIPKLQGTRFSHTSNKNDIPQDEDGVSRDLHDFAQAFFKQHPQFSKNEFYITGESYAGHYIPAFAARVHRGNKAKEGIQINLKYYDIRKKCEGSLCYDFSNMETFLNRKSVKDALGVGDIEFESCSNDVYDAMYNAWMRNLEVGIPALLEDGIRMLVYAGEYDLICNWLGNSRWVHAMKWSGQQQFGAAVTVPFIVDSAQAGLMKNHGPLTFLKVHDACHMVPKDQPKPALLMLRSWMQGTLNITETKDNVYPRS